jgi:two-component system sensor histidine kinase KdpD
MESERLRNSVLAAVSHDLRTPLAALVGLADTLAITPTTGDEVGEIAGRIRDQAHRMATMVGNLLDMARCSRAT